MTQSGEWIEFDIRLVAFGASWLMAACGGHSTPQGVAPQQAEAPQASSAPELPAEASKTRASGRLAPEVIQKIVRARYDRIQHCNELGLGRDAKLTGRVEIRFVIERDGKVSAAQPSTATTLPDPEAVECVTQVFRSLAFPPPDGGIVTVVYPVMLAPE